MIWDSILLVTVIDVAIVSIAVTMLWVRLKAKPLVLQSASTKGAMLVVLGVSLTGLFSLADLATMFVLPLIVEQTLVTLVMEYLHLYARWPVTLASLLLVVVGFMSTLHEQARDKEIARLQTDIVENMAEGVNLVRASDGHIVYTNHRCDQMFGYSPGELVGKHVSIMNAPGEVTSVEVYEAIATHLKRHKTWSGEVHNVRKNGTTFWCYANVSTFEHSVYGAVWVGAQKDIDERKQMQQALAESHARSQTILETAVDGIITIDEKGIIESCNTSATRMFGYNAEEVIGKKVNLLMPSPHDRQHDEYISRYLQTGEARIIGKGREVEGRRKDGTVFPIDLAVSEIRVNGRSLFTGIMRDISDRKEAEKDREQLISALEGKNAEMEQFTYTVSHDLKSPLITIQGFLGLLEKGVAAGDTVRMKDDMERIRSAARTMHQLLQDLLELARIGQVIKPREEVFVSELVHEALERVTGQVAERGVRVDITPDLPVVWGDRSRLIEVFQNLIDNAIKYMGDQDAPRVEIGAKPRGEDLVFYVRDNGVGIEPRFHDKVFHLFERLDPKTEGTGVGLALVKRIVEQHEGRIWVESEGMGRGCVFCFTLAAQEGDGHDVR